MDVSMVTAATPGRRNEDLVIATPKFVVVLDGATTPAYVWTGCVHDPEWLVCMLGPALAARLSEPGDHPLPDILEAAITDVRNTHASTCDLTNPESPSTTVAILRERDDQLDYLVLCDSPIVFTDRAGQVSEVVADNRTATMHSLTRQQVNGRRNHPGGFWVASTDPRAAHQARTGTRSRAGTGATLVCTDGVSRLVDHFGHSWQQLLDLAQAGPLRAVIDAVRCAEAPGPPPGSRKQHDDATAALCTFGG
jgi:hypothetical protein